MAKGWGMKAAPTTGQSFVGDKVHNISPTAGGVSYWQCVASGTPGTWKAVNLAA